MIDRKSISNPDEICTMYFNKLIGKFVFEGYDVIGDGCIFIRQSTMINLLNYADILYNFKERWNIDTIANIHSALSEETIDKIITLYSKQYTQRDISNELNVSLGVVNKYIRKYAHILCK